MMFPILALSDSCVHVLFIGAQSTGLDCVDPQMKPSRMSECVRVVCVRVWGENVSAGKMCAQRPVHRRTASIHQGF